MTDDRTTHEEDSALAAEYALGLLEVDERLHAERLVAADPDFRADVERWRGRLGSMFDQIEPVAAPPETWSRIEAAIRAPALPSNVRLLQRKVTVWRAVAASMTALAASLALFVMARPASTIVTPAPQAASAPPIVARVSAGQQIAVVANWDSQRGELLLATAAGLPVGPARSNELWVIPAGGKPRSLGLMPDADHAVVPVPAAAIRLIRAGATIAVSVEPRGGSPTGAPTGPVVASGLLEAG